jgi:hypothetical protein
MLNKEATLQITLMCKTYSKEQRWIRWHDVPQGKGPNVRGERVSPETTIL